MSPKALMHAPAAGHSLALIEEARTKLVELREQIDSDETIAEIRVRQRRAGAIGKLYGEVEEVRREAELTVLVGEHRIGQELSEITTAAPGRPKNWSAENQFDNSRPISLTELVGSRHYGMRLKQLGRISRAELESCIAEIHETSPHEATVRGILKMIAGAETKTRREQSRAALALDGLDLRIGDARIVLDDIAPNSVPLILTDPPYGNDAEPLYEWLAQWAARVLIPGGSLICFTGQSKLDRDMQILGRHLKYWWLLIMPHQQAQRIPGRFVTANFKPVLWHVKEHRRGRTLLPDVLTSPNRDKLAHDWAQGNGGVWSVIEHLTEPGELIVDPFAGTATWGRVANEMGRYWIGADIEPGGSERIVA